MAGILFLNPRSDQRFVQTVESTMAGGITEPGELQARLRDLYPAAIVRVRDLSGEIDPVWYVYRDGRWVSPYEEAEGEG
jgi:hypothetical protein